MLKLRNRSKIAARRVAAPRAPLSPQEVRELLIADSAPLRMSRAAAEYVRRAEPGGKFDVRDRLREVGREETCFGCFRPVFMLAAEQPGPMCEQCVEQGRGWFTATLGLAEVRAVDLALGARLQGTADYLMAEVLGCRPVLCGDCGSRFYVYVDQSGPHSCRQCSYKDGI